MSDTPDDERGRPPRAPRKRPSASGESGKAADGPASKQAATRRRPRGEPTSDGSRARRDAPEASGPSASSAQLALAAAQQVVALTGKPFEGVVGLRREDHGWDVEVEVVEMRRVPNTTDVIAVYRVKVDPQGDLLDYQRVHRYQRGQAGDER